MCGLLPFIMGAWTRDLAQLWPGVAVLAGAVLGTPGKGHPEVSLPLLLPALWSPEWNQAAEVACRPPTPALGLSSLALVHLRRVGDPGPARALPLPPGGLARGTAWGKHWLHGRGVRLRRPPCARRGGAAGVWGAGPRSPPLVLTDTRWAARQLSPGCSESHRIGR